MLFLSDFNMSNKQTVLLVFKNLKLSCWTVLFFDILKLRKRAPTGSNLNLFLEIIFWIQTSCKYKNFELFHMFSFSCNFDQFSIITFGWVITTIVFKNDSNAEALKLDNWSGYWLYQNLVTSSILKEKKQILHVICLLDCSFGLLRLCQMYLCNKNY